jgi:hypothetical protein
MKIIAHDSDRRDLIGQEVTIHRIVTEPEPGFDAEVLPMVYVTTAYGETVLCFFDELDPMPDVGGLDTRTLL